MKYLIKDGKGRFVTSPYYLLGTKSEAKVFGCALEAKIMKRALEGLDGREYKIIEAK